ncbi:MAG: M23 family metallopeptidase [Saprospiraceae bacterium]|nr:M23 family metallopeptidase [Saprospiraceae bacterium]
MTIRYILYSLGLAWTCLCCRNEAAEKTPTVLGADTVTTEVKSGPLASTITFPKPYIATAFDFPVGKPNAKGYYNAQGFGLNYHLGDDWNAVTGGNSDLGDPIYSIANGQVNFAEDIGAGWGKVVQVLHQMPDGEQYESLYAHCDSILVQTGDWVKRGQQIATIGNADGQYYAHLHLEIRDSIGMPIGGGYAADTSGYLDPTRFIRTHRVISN